MKTLLTFTLIFVFAIPNQAQTRRAARAAATRAPASGQSTRAQLPQSLPIRRVIQLEKDRRAAVEERSRLQAEVEAAIRGLVINRALTP